MFACISRVENSVDLFVGLAGIAGVFVGFAALISFSQADDVEEHVRVQIRGVVSIGLMVIIAALIPVGLSRYGLTDRTGWFISSLIFLVLAWVVIVTGLRMPEHRAAMRQTSRPAALFFWLALELPIHVPLVLAVIGVNPSLDAAFYTTALVFHLFEGAFVLTQLVYAQVKTT